MSTAQQIKSKFGNEWFHITDLSQIKGFPKMLGFQATLVTELVADGLLEYFPNSRSMARVIRQQDSNTELRKFFAKISK